MFSGEFPPKTAFFGRKLVFLVVTRFPHTATLSLRQEESHTSSSNRMDASSGAWTEVTAMTLVKGLASLEVALDDPWTAAASR